MITSQKYLNIGSILIKVVVFVFYMIAINFPWINISYSEEVGFPTIEINLFFFYVGYVILALLTFLGIKNSKITGILEQIGIIGGLPALIFYLIFAIQSSFPIGIAPYQISFQMGYFLAYVPVAINFIERYGLRKKFNQLLGREAIQKKEIKDTILELGTKYPRLLVVEIAEKTNQGKDLIIETVEDMIDNEEIYAQYFESSKSVVFDQQANIDNIDKLMDSFKDWEKEGRGKKE